MCDFIERSHGDVLVLTLSRPEKRNALTHDMKAALLAAVEREAASPRHRAVLLTGAGGAFCSGADATPAEILARRETIEAELKEQINRIIVALRALPVPVVAALPGSAAGAGVGLALAADLMVVSPSARLHIAFAEIGAVPDAGTIVHLARRVGTTRTAALAFLGGVVTADQAIAWGLAAKQLPEDGFVDEAIAFAHRLARGPTQAFVRIKRLIAAAEQLDLAALLDLEARLQGEAFATADFEEGVRARAEKRLPIFTGA